MTPQAGGLLGPRYPVNRCFLVQAPPGTGEFSRALEAAKPGGRASHLYLVDEAARGADLPEIAALAKAGVRLFACVHAIRKRRLPPPAPHVIQAGLILLRDLILHTKALDCFGLTPLPGGPPASQEWLHTRSRPKGLTLWTNRDPAHSGAPAEALRLAAGLHRPGRLHLRLILEGPAQSLLLPGCELLDGADFIQAAERQTIADATQLSHPLPHGSPTLAMG